MSQLFNLDISPVDTPDDPRNPKLSSGRRRTLKQRAMIAAGRHPMGLGAIDLEHTCGGCVHAKNRFGGARSYWKCELIPHTGGPGTDLRLKWPACPRWAVK